MEEHTSYTIEEVVRQRDEYLEGWKRAKADFLNYKKEEMERLASVGEMSKTRIARDFLSVVDTVEKAERHIVELADADNLRTGFALVAKQIKNIAQSHGIREIEALGTPFNPEIHEAVAERAQDGISPGIVIDVVEKGYVMGEKLLRPVKVVVAE